MPVGKVRIVHPNVIDGATLSGEPAFVAALPEANLQDQTREYVGRAATSKNQVIWGNFAQLSALTMMALCRHNMTLIGTARLKLWDNLGRSGVLLYDSGAQAIGTGTLVPWGPPTNPDGWGRFPWGMSGVSDWPSPTFRLWFTQVQAYSFELTLDDPANQKSYIQASRLFMGKAWEPADNLSWGTEIGFRESTTQRRAEGGSLRPGIPGAQYRRISFSLDWLTDANAAELLELSYRAGKSKDLFISCYPEAGGTKERNAEGLVMVVQMPDTKSSKVNIQRASLVFEES